LGFPSASLEKAYSMSNRRFRRREPHRLKRPWILRIARIDTPAVSFGAAAYLTHWRCLQIDEMFAEGSSDRVTSDNRVTEMSGAAEKR
jgi:hypothetical protein